jgi:hypothetical protein
MAAEYNAHAHKVAFHGVCLPIRFRYMADASIITASKASVMEVVCSVGMSMNSNCSPYA